MGRHINQGAAALLGLIGENAPGWNAPTPPGRGLGVVNIPQCAGVHIGLHCPVVIHVAVLVSDGQELSGAQMGFVHFQRIGIGCCHGLFADNMFTGLHSGAGNFTMLHIGRQHMDSINLRAGQQLTVVRENLGPGTAILLPGLLRPLRDNVTECIQFHTRSLGGHAGQVLIHRNAAAADESNF